MRPPMGSGPLGKEISKAFVKILASGFGLGFLPKFPGTWGTLLGIPLFWWVAYRQDLSSMLFIFFFTFASVIIAELASPQFNSVDSPHIVIDEVAGYLVTVVWLPRTWQTVVFGFIIFRILDISKPGPIRFIERRLKGGLGIVMDDVVAGIIGNILLQGVYQNTKWLGQI